MTHFWLISMTDFFPKRPASHSCRHMNESCRTCHTWMSHVTHEVVTSHHTRPDVVHHNITHPIHTHTHTCIHQKSETNYTDWWRIPCHTDTHTFLHTHTLSLTHTRKTWCSTLQRAASHKHTHAHKHAYTRNLRRITQIDSGFRVTQTHSLSHAHTHTHTHTHIHTQTWCSAPWHHASHYSLPPPAVATSGLCVQEEKLWTQKKFTRTKLKEGTDTSAPSSSDKKKLDQVKKEPIIWIHLYNL